MHADPAQQLEHPADVVFGGRADVEHRAVHAAFDDFGARPGLRQQLLFGQLLQHFALLGADELGALLEFEADQFAQALLDRHRIGREFVETHPEKIPGGAGLVGRFGFDRLEAGNLAGGGAGLDFDETFFFEGRLFEAHGDVETGEADRAGENSHGGGFVVSGARGIICCGASVRIF